MTETRTPRRPLRPEELFDAAMALRERAEKAEAEVDRLKEALKSCWHAANTYDGNYANACDGVMTIAADGLESTTQ